jgi:hypothetical protein
LVPKVGRKPVRTIKIAGIGWVECKRGTEILREMGVLCMGHATNQHYPSSQKNLLDLDHSSSCFGWLYRQNKSSTQYLNTAYFRQ